MNLLNRNMESIEIKKVTLNDIVLLQKIGRQTFFETFSTRSPDDNMTKYLNESFALEKLTNELKEECSEFYFAILGSHVIGYLKLNTGQAQTELKDNKALEIERIYVLKEFHGKKVGQLLYEEAIRIAEQKKVEYIWLGVWEENLRAISFYTKNGFVGFDKHLFKLGDKVETDIMMKKVLVSN